MTEPIVIEPTVMKSSSDCALCCLKMLLGVTYSEVLLAVPKKLQRTVANTGLTTKQIINVAARLGHTLKYQTTAPEDDDVGILDLSRADGGHVVMWLKGVIYNPADNELWTDDEAFLQRGQWIVDGFLWRRQ